MSRGLDGTNPRSYVGVRPLTPPNMIIPGIRPTSQPRDPTQNDIQYNLGDLWLNTNTEGLWYLAALGSHLVGGINTRFATWLQFGTGTVKTLTGNTGGPVGPDANGNINTIGDVVSGIVVNGNPGTNTLTWTSSGGGHFGETLTGDTGGAVQFDAAGNINVIANNAALNAGSTVLIVGTPLNNTLTLDVTDASSNTILGKNSGNLTLTGSGNSGFGSGVLINLTTGLSNTAVGVNAVLGCSTGSNNTGIGAASLTTLSTGSNNVGVGASSLTAATTGSFNTALGSGLSLGSLTTGASNTAVGYSSLDDITTGSNNTALGAGAGGTLATSDSNNVLINHAGIAGSTSKWFFSFGNAGNLFSHNYGTRNTFLGDLSGNTTLTVANAINNTGVGYDTLNVLTTGFNNVGVGFGACSAVTTGSNNIALGVNACDQVTTGAANIGIGNGSNAATTGSNNVAVGSNCLAGGTFDGSTNSVYGHSAASTYAGAESDNVIIHNVGVAAESNVIRIGSNGGLLAAQTKCFIAGIRGRTTVVNDAIAVLIDSAGQLGTVSSSIIYKENVENIGRYSESLFNLRPVRFNYKERRSEVKSVGLIAEEVEKVMPDLVVYKDDKPETVKYLDLIPLLLNELQHMHREMIKMQCRINDMEETVHKNNA